MMYMYIRTVGLLQCYSMMVEPVSQSCYMRMCSANVYVYMCACAYMYVQNTCSYTNSCHHIFVKGSLALTQFLDFCQDMIVVCVQKTVALSTNLIPMYSCATLLFVETWESKHGIIM